LTAKEESIMTESEICNNDSQANKILAAYSMKHQPLTHLGSCSKDFVNLPILKRKLEELIMREMTETMNEFGVVNSSTEQDNGLPYETQKLRRHGKVTDITCTGGPRLSFDGFFLGDFS
jgi:hypothetical protein